MHSTRTPHLVARLQGRGTTIFAEMSALAARHDAVNLGQGFPDFDPPTALTEAARTAIADGHNQYAPGIGVAELRRAVSDHTARHHDLVYDPDTEVTISTGATEGTVAALQALVELGDEVVVLSPVYDVYPAAVAMAGGRAVEVPLRAGIGGRWQLDPGELAAAVGPRTRAILLNTPHNPTGAVLSGEALQGVADVAIRHDLLVITDEVYEHLVYDGAVHTPIAGLPGMRERTIRISSAGKTFSVTGWKVGWVQAPPPLTDAIRLAKQWITFTSGTPFQHAVAEALGWGEDFLTPLAEGYAARRDALQATLADLGMEVHPAEGTYFTLADVRPLGFADDRDFCDLLPEHAGVGAIPVSAFCADPTACRGLVRFAFCKTDALLEEGVRRLRSRLDAVPRQRG